MKYNWDELGFTDVEEIGLRDNNDELLVRLPAPTRPESLPVPKSQTRNIRGESQPYIGWEEPITRTNVAEIQITPYDGERQRINTRSRDPLTGQFESDSDHWHTESYMTSGTVALVRGGKDVYEFECICQNCRIRNYKKGEVYLLKMDCDYCGEPLIS